MATFKVGTRVKFVCTAGYMDEVPIGTTGIVMPPFLNAMGDEVSVRCDSVPRGSPNRYARPFQLAPITDPRAEAFIAKVKSWGALKEPMTMATLTERVLSHIRGGSL